MTDDLLTVGGRAARLGRRSLASVVDGAIAIAVGLAVTNVAAPGADDEAFLAVTMFVAVLVRLALRLDGRVDPGLRLTRLSFASAAADDDAPTLPRRVVWNAIATLIWLTVLVPPYLTPVVVLLVLAGSLLASPTAATFQDRAAGLRIVRRPAPSPARDVDR